jgi:hypothetical protein
MKVKWVASNRGGLTGPFRLIEAAKCLQFRGLPGAPVAEGSPGFVWRLRNEDIPVDQQPAPQLLVNMSVWRSIDALHDYVYRSAHANVYRERARWIEPMVPHLALWWLSAAHLPPSLAEGLARLEILRERGPSQEAFTFKQRFVPPHHHSTD